MYALAEQLPQIKYFESQQETLPVLVVSEMAEDLLIQYRAARFIGEVLLSGTIEVNNQSETINEAGPESLMEAIHRASKGDEQSRKLIETNVRTDVIERTIKSGHITQVQIDLDDQGNLSQFGQTMKSVYANSLRYSYNNSKMRPRTDAETRNAFRIEQLFRSGTLEDYNFVVFSRASDDMSDEEMADIGFFVDTMSCAIQVTTANGTGLTTETAFVAGKKHNDSQRHDAEMIADLGNQIGINYSQMTAARTIDNPVLIHKNMMPNGVIDLVKLNDELLGGTFFGEARPTQNYLQYAANCTVREKAYEPKVRQIADQLIDEFYTILTPLMATERLHKISEEHMVEYAVQNESINPRVFGDVAAPHIVNARFEFARGNFQTASAETNKAKETSESRSCQSGTKSSSEFEGDTNTSSDSSDSDKYGSLKFKCDKCGHINTRPRGRLIENCQNERCKASARC